MHEEARAFCEITMERSAIQEKVGPAFGRTEASYVASVPTEKGNGDILCSRI
jgi:hypothetical protein